MSLVHRVGRSLGVAGIALALIVGTAFAHDALSSSSPVGSAEDAPLPPAPVVAPSTGDVQDQAGDQNDQQGDSGDGSGNSNN